MSTVSLFYRFTGEYLVHTFQVDDPSRHHNANRPEYRMLLVSHQNYE
jgi:hypothetical protein